MTYSDVIIKRLTDLCNERKITVNKLATLSGITQSTVDNLIKGKKSQVKNIAQISNWVKYDCIGITGFS